MAATGAGVMAICMAMEAAEAGVDGIGIGMVFGVAFPPIPETFLMGVVDNEAGVSLSSSLSLILSIIFAEVVLNESEDMGDRGFLCVGSVFCRFDLLQEGCLACIELSLLPAFRKQKKTTLCNRKLH